MYFWTGENFRASAFLMVAVGGVEGEGVQVEPWAFNPG